MKRCVSVVLLTVGLVSTADSQETAGSLRVGFSLPLSGVAAEYGAAVRNGIELALLVRIHARTTRYAPFRLPMPRVRQMHHTRFPMNIQAVKMSFCRSSLIHRSHFFANQA